MPERIDIGSGIILAAPIPAGQLRALSERLYRERQQQITWIVPSESSPRYLESLCYEQAHSSAFRLGLLVTGGHYGQLCRGDVKALDQLGSMLTRFGTVLLEGNDEAAIDSVKRRYASCEIGCIYAEDWSSANAIEEATAIADEIFKERDEAPDTDPISDNEADQLTTPGGG